MIPFLSHQYSFSNLRLIQFGKIVIDLVVGMPLHPFLFVYTLGSTMSRYLPVPFGTPYKYNKVEYHKYHSLEAYTPKRIIRRCTQVYHTENTILPTEISTFLFRQDTELSAT